LDAAACRSSVTATKIGAEHTIPAGIRYLLSDFKLLIMLNVIKQKISPEVCNYPLAFECIMKGQRLGCIVLFTGLNKGLLVKRGNDEAPSSALEYSENWTSHEFSGIWKPVDISITAK